MLRGNLLQHNLPLIQLKLNKSVMRLLIIHLFSPLQLYLAATTPEMHKQMQIHTLFKLHIKYTVEHTRKQCQNTSCGTSNGLTFYETHYTAKRVWLSSLAGHALVKDSPSQGKHLSLHMFLNHRKSTPPRASYHHRALTREQTCESAHTMSTQQGHCTT